MNQDKIVAIYVMADDILKTLGHTSDVGAQVSDAEVLTVAIVAASECENRNLPRNGQFPLTLVKQVFVNADGSLGIEYLVSSGNTLTADQITTIYRIRWTGEPYYKSLKQNASLEKFLAHAVISQSNHLFASLYAYIKLEWLRKAICLNHFALKTGLYVAAFQSPFLTLRQLQPVQLPA